MTAAIAITAFRPPWPAPALLAWGLAWAGWWLLRQAGADAPVAYFAATAAGIAAAWPNRTPWRRGLAATGFPLSAALSAALSGATLLPWAWLAAVAVVAALYPLRAWRDAPFFPTPADALDGLAEAVGTAPSNILDVGCGLGHGLKALERAWPEADLSGIEWSRPMALAAAWRCRRATVRRGDMWAADWRPFDLVYVFQRPESMARAWDKARRDMAGGGWLVSLEFEVPGRQPDVALRRPGRRAVYGYRVGAAGAVTRSPRRACSTAAPAGR